MGDGYPTAQTAFPHAQVLGASRLIRKLSSAQINCKDFLVDPLANGSPSTSYMELDGVSFGHDVCNKVFFFTCNTSPTYICSVSYICIPYYRGSAVVLDCEVMNMDNRFQQQGPRICSRTCI